MGNRHEVDLQSRGGVHFFEKWDDVLAMIDCERTRWSWLLNGGFSDRFNVQNHVNRRLDWARRTATEWSDGGSPIAESVRLLNDLYLGSEPILHSEGDLGRQILEIFDATGKDTAAFAYVLATSMAAPNQAQSLTDFRAVVMLVAPSIASTHTIAETLRRERKNLRERAERHLEKLAQAEDLRASENRRMRQLHRRAAKRFAKGRFGSWQSTFDSAVRLAADQQSEFARHQASILEEFDATRAAFKEYMHLEAPVTYWDDKAKKHGKTEDRARKRLLIYFPVAILGLIGLFAFAAHWLMEQRPPGPPTAIYFIISGGLATIAGMAFWVGRLLTKLYLSEHHLRHDAEERAVMTTTYLALTKDKAAEETDRHIVLAQLFRTTPDGIVKDDGPPDFNLAMLLARLGLPGK